MKRLMVALAAAAMLTAAFVVPAAAGHRSDHRSTPTPSLRLEAESKGVGAAAMIKIEANLKGVPKDARKADYTGSAVFHFSDGDVTVPLTRHGRSLEFKGRAPVSAGNTNNPVAVDVTVVGNGATYTATKNVRLRTAPACTPDPSPSHDQDDDDDCPSPAVIPTP